MVEWVEGAGVQSEKAGFPLEFIPHTMRGGNDKYSFRNRNYLGTTNKVMRLPAILAGRSTFAKSCNNSVIWLSIA